MSTPMFIREPIAGTGVSTLLGTDFTIVPETTEATLVEDIFVTAENFSTDAGRLLLRMYISGTPYRCGAYEIAAGTATLEAFERLEVNITLPVGATLKAQHSVQLSGGGGHAPIHAVVLGGVVR